MTTETIRIFVEIDTDLAAFISHAEEKALEIVTDGRWKRAVIKAAMMLDDLSCFAWHAETQTLLVTSPQSGKTYEASASGCGCEAHAAGKPCWHRAAARLVQRAYEARTQRREAAARAAAALENASEYRRQRLIELQLLDVRSRSRSRMYA